MCVGAFGAGESPLQHYNSTLALHHLQVFADAIIFRGNDDLLKYSRPATTPAAGSEVNGGRGRTDRGTRHHNDSGGGGGRGSGTVVSTADMNQTLALDMASYFFPTTKLLSSATQDDPYSNCSSPPADALHTRRGSSRSSGRYPGEDYESRRAATKSRQAAAKGSRWVSTPRYFDGGSLMAAACPLPAASFVDLRSTLSSSFGAQHQYQQPLDGVCLSELPSSDRDNSNWAGLAGFLGKTAPLCPRKGGGHRRDACVAVHQMVRGVEGPTARSAVSAWNGDMNAGKRAGTTMTATGQEHAVNKGVEGGSLSAAETAEISAGLRIHHECDEWRTATDVSYSAGAAVHEGTILYSKDDSTMARLCCCIETCYGSFDASESCRGRIT